MARPLDIDALHAEVVKIVAARNSTRLSAAQLAEVDPRDVLALIDRYRELADENWRLKEFARRNGETDEDFRRNGIAP